MSPLPLAAVNYTVNTQAPSFASNSSGNISTIVFGVLAVIASIIGIWQARKAWDIWQERRHPHAVMSTGAGAHFRPRLIESLIDLVTYRFPPRHRVP